MDAPRVARCSRPTVGSTGLLVSADDQQPPVCSYRPVVGTHRVVRDAHGRPRRNADRSGGRADRWSAALPPDTAKPDGRTAPCAAQPTNGRLYRVVCVGRRSAPAGLFVSAFGRHPPRCLGRPTVGPRRNPDRSWVEPTVGRLLFLPAPRYAIGYPAPCAVQPTNDRLYRRVGVG